MLCRRAVVAVAGIRRMQVSTVEGLVLCGRAVVAIAGVRRMQVSTVEDLMFASRRTQKRINPVTRNPILDGPPVASGPAVYRSPEDNPLSKRYATDGLGLRFAVRPSHRLDCITTPNNTITTLSSLTYTPADPFKPPTSNVVAWFSGGSVGYKKAQRATFEAAHQCAIRIFKLIEEAKAARPDEIRVHVYFRGFGPGREAIKTALMAPDGDNIRDTIKQLIDRTPIKIGGTRAKKTRRL